MKKYNVICCHCGKKEYNQNIPDKHILDTCRDPKCIKKAGELFVVFKDGNKLNNNVDNLEWVTYSENMLHAYDIGLLKRKQVLMSTKNGKPLLVFSSLREASRELNIYISSISECCNGKRKTAGGYKWQFA